MGRNKNEASRMTVVCVTCELSFWCYRNRPRKFCSRKCVVVYQKGPNNPNSGNVWNQEQRKHQSDIMFRRFAKNPELRWKFGATNRGKKFSPERIAKTHHPGRTPESYHRPSPSAERRKQISEQSAAKFKDPEYIKRVRKTNESNGNWISDLDKIDVDVYRKLAGWIERMWDRVEDPEGKLKKFGIKHYKNNPSGVVRDHNFSILDGFDLGIFPEILRHPVNCQILTHRENVKKRRKSWLTLDQLFDKIVNYDNEWSEHNEVLKLITEYKMGKRWQRKGGST